MAKLDIIRFFQNINKLKRIKRTGWVLKGVRKPESVAEHTFRVAVLAYILTKDIAHINTEKLVKMALIHEFGEISAGDIPTGARFESRKGYLKRKHKLESQGVKELLKDIPPPMRREVRSLWNEADEKKTVEAKWLKNLDKLEMALQALDYELEGYSPKKLNEFWEDAERKITEPEVLQILKKATKLRRKKKK
jgi:putative hydrolase of HD superfamily